MEEALPRPCSIASALAFLGEKWALLVVRELALGVHRFDEIQRNTGAPRDILTSRLRRLEAAGVLEKRQYQDRPVRFGYHLTRAGGELRPILLSLAQWGDRWASPPQVSSWVHTCGEEADVVHTCRACGEEITGYDLRLRYGAAVAGDSTA
ncbi:MAG TPA: helix-turn-helix domain-containing protein [Gaiellaceae bacterium]|jgi:DNA-binding HxlR family transcriptional regulator|nr:helix-turn-helix domain-containing protein [Gaiellaceae bacterium]